VGYPLASLLLPAASVCKLGAPRWARHHPIWTDLVRYIRIQGINQIPNKVARSKVLKKSERSFYTLRADGAIVCINFGNLSE
jgi:hypothetical protein